MVISAIAHPGRAEDRQVLLHLPVGLSSRQTAHRRLSGAHNDRSQSHRQWLAVTAPAGRAYAVERARAHLPPGAPLLPNEAGAEEGGRRPKKRSAKKAEEATAAKKLSPTPLYYPLLAHEQRSGSAVCSRSVSPSPRRHRLAGVCPPPRPRDALGLVWPEARRKGTFAPPARTVCIGGSKSVQS